MSGVSLWREEARVAVSVVELVGQLEGTWGDLLDRLEQAQVGLGGGVPIGTTYEK